MIASLYPYDPSKVLPIVFACINFTLTLAIFCQSWHYRWIHFSWMMTWAGLVWLTGFVTRSISVFHTSNIPLFITQYATIFAGPPIFAASEYFILGRLLSYLPYHTPIHPDRVFSTFVILSAVVESLAISGATVIASTNASESARTAALDRVKASLILQEVVEMSFFGLVALIEYRCRRSKNFPRNVKVICRILYVTSIMMTLRCAIRTVEGFETGSCDPSSPGYDGYCGPVQTQEWYLWVFEVANITVFVLLLAIFHPGRYLPSNNKQYLHVDTNEGNTERIGPGFSKADDRPWIKTVLDPFDWASLISRKEARVHKFWEENNAVASKTFSVRGKK